MSATVGLRIPGLTSRSQAYYDGPTKHADHFVYRCYDADDVLLYVGCTVDVDRRLKSHFGASASNTTSWWLSLYYDHHEIEGPFAGRDAGREAESDAIRGELPIFNQQGTVYYVRTQVLQRVATYLVEHGNRSLAIETCCICRTEYIANRRLCRAHFYEAAA